MSKEFHAKTKAHDDVAERYRLASTLLDAATRLISSSDRAEVLQGFCNTLVTATPHVRLAWLWMGELDAQEVTPMIFAGPAREYAEQLRIQRGWLVQKGPVFQVLSGSEVSEMNISPRSLYRPWRIAATRWGFQRAVVLKFAASTPEQVGLLALYVDEREYFSRVGLDPIRAMARVVESILRQWDMVERLEEQIEIDPLTNIYNRRGWERRLHLELQQCRRRESMVGIGILDLDDLKTVATRRESEARASSPWKATRCTASAKTTAAAGSVGACSAAWWPSSQWETSAPSAPQRGRDGAPVTRTSRAHSSNRQRKAVRAWTREKAYLCLGISLVGLVLSG